MNKTNTKVSGQWIKSIIDKQQGFTLAEVLITLGIIGVVAALTMPILINKTQDKVLETQQMKSRSILANGYKLMLAKTETFDITNLPFLNNCNSMNDLHCVSKEHKTVFNIVMDTPTGLSGYSLPSNYDIVDENDPSPFNWSDVPYLFTTADGMIYGVEADNSLQSFDVYTDINGTKGPNTVKSDLFKYRIVGNTVITDVSDELYNEDRCSIDSLENCTTSEMCLGLSYIKDADGKCPGVWYDDYNGCNSYGISEYYCR